MTDIEARVNSNYPGGFFFLQSAAEVPDHLSFVETGKEEGKTIGNIVFGKACAACEFVTVSCPGVAGIVDGHLQDDLGQDLSPNSVKIPCTLNHYPRVLLPEELVTILPELS